MWRTPAHASDDAQDRFLKVDYQHMAARFIRHFYMAQEVEHAPLSDHNWSLADNSSASCIRL
ncbi:hypothetical protein K663_09805 [Sphingobium sp. MI1205]|nr:hypothetical protein K663_09805 [Sphingobium sp. MI1205]